MQAVSSAFLTAITAVEREIKQKTQIVWLDNSMLGLSPAYSASSTCDADYTPASRAFNGKVAAYRKYAWVGEDIYPADDLYPVPDGGEIGWWGNNACNSSGYFATPETLSIDYGSSQTFRNVNVWFDSRFGYATNFSIQYSTAASPGASDWSTLTTVMGNSTTEWGYTCSSPLHARHLRLSITGWSIGSKRPKVMEFEGGYTTWMTDRVKSFSITKERNANDDANTLPIGNSSANELSLVLDNTDDAFYQRNKTSPYYGYLVQDRKVRVWLGVVLADGSVEYVPQGTFYTVGWGASRSSPECTVRAWDQAKRMNDKDFAESIVYESKTASELVSTLCLSYGLDVGQYVVDTTTEVIPYAYFEKAKYWSHLNELAKGETGYVYFNETNQLIFENRSHLFTTRLASDAYSGATSITLVSAYGLSAGDVIYISDGTNTQQTSVSSSWNGSTTVPLVTSLTYTFYADSYVYRQPVVATLRDSDVLIDMDDAFALDKARNKIEVTAKPYVVPMAGGLPEVVTIWQLTEGLTVPANDHLDIDVFFSGSPVIKNDTYDLTITLTTETGGDEAYISTSWQPSTPYAWGGHLRFTNTKGAEVVVIGCLIEGVVLEEAGGIVEKAQDAVLISTQGERVYSIESRFVQKRAHAQAIANSMLAIWKNPSAPISCTGVGLPHLQLGDHIKLIDSELGLTDANMNNHGYLTRIVLDYDGGLGATYEVLAV